MIITITKKNNFFFKYIKKKYIVTSTKKYLIFISSYQFNLQVTTPTSNLSKLLNKLKIKLNKNKKKNNNRLSVIERKQDSIPPRLSQSLFLFRFLPLFPHFLSSLSLPSVFFPDLFSSIPISPSHFHFHFHLHV